MQVLEELRLIALDEEDLAVVSCHVQDAVAKVGDTVWLPRERRFALALNRFAWEAMPKRTWARGPYERRRSALHFERVEAAKCSGFDCRDKERVLSLLAIQFETTDPPSGCVRLLFSGGASIRLDVECLEAQLADLGPRWSTPHAPRHRID